MAESENDPYIGRTVDNKYTITERVGKGGMGSVYKAEHHLMGRVVAIKILTLKDSDVDRSEFLRRFKQEAQTVAKLRHPGSVTIYDYGIDTFGTSIEIPYLVMEYVDGKTLKLLAQEEELTVDRIVNIIAQTCGALEEAHSLGVVHRDMKPDNLMITGHHDGSDWVKVLDFGVAKVRAQETDINPEMTRAGTIVGTPRYMAPEQALGKSVDGRTDIYALGVILYELLSGTPPFDAPTSMELLVKHLQEKPAKFSDLNSKHVVSKSLERVVLRALEKEADKRPQTAKEFARELLLAAPPKGNKSVDSLLQSLHIESPNRRKATPYALAGGFFALVVCIGLLLSGGTKDSPSVEGEKSNVIQRDTLRAIVQEKEAAEEAKLKESAARAEAERRAAEAELKAAEAEREANKARQAALSAERTSAQLKSKIEAVSQEEKVEAEKQQAEIEQRSAEAERKMAEIEKNAAEAMKRVADAEQRAAQSEKQAALLRQTAAERQNQLELTAEESKKKAEAELRAQEAERRAQEAEAKAKEALVRLGDAEKKAKELAEKAAKEAEAKKTAPVAPPVTAVLVPPPALSVEQKAEAEKMLLEAKRIQQEAEARAREAERKAREAEERSKRVQEIEAQRRRAIVEEQRRLEELRRKQQLALPPPPPAKEEVEVEESEEEAPKKRRRRCGPNWCD